MAHDALLRHTLRANALFSATAGLVMLVAAAPLADWLGVPSAIYLVVIGVGLLVFAYDLFTNARRPKLHRGRVRQAIVMDALWVVGSIALLVSLGGLFTTVGWWAIVVVADIVALFAIVQALGLRRSQRQRDDA